MIWQQRSCVIVMLTKLREKSLTKVVPLLLLFALFVHSSILVFPFFLDAAGARVLAHGPAERGVGVWSHSGGLFGAEDAAWHHDQHAACCVV